MRLSKPQNFIAAALGGASAGFVVAAIPHTPVWKAIEIGHARAYAIEGFVLFAGRVLPGAVLNTMVSPAGIFVFFIILGILMSLPAPLFAGRKQTAARNPMISGAVWAWAGFVFLFLASMLKTLFFYPVRTIFSFRGFLFLATAAVLTAAAGFLLNLILKTVRRAGPTLVLAPVIAAAVFLLPLGGSRDAAPGDIRKVLLVGIDAATWNVILPLVEEGRLPHFRSFMDEGSYGQLRSFLPISSPLLWTTIATGKRPAEHGITGFTVQSPETGGVLPISVGARTAPALWDIAGNSDKSVGVVNWYGGWPAEEVNGVFVSSRIGLRTIPLRVHPPERTGEFEELAPEEAILESDPVSRLTFHLWNEDRPDLLMAFFPRLDFLQHRYWKYHDLVRNGRLSRGLHPGTPSREIEDLGDVVLSEYLRLDTVLGGLIETSGKDTAIVVVSDHGAGPARGPRTFQTRPLLEHLGWLHLEPGAKNIDWKRTQVFDGSMDIKPRRLPRTFLLNSRPEGPFGDGTETGESRAFIAEALNSLDALRTVSGRRVITRIKTEKDTVSGKTKILVWINLDIHADDPVIFSDSSVPAGDLFQQQRLSGMHRLEGVFLARGPGIRKGYRIKGASVMDIAPTVLHLLGLPAARDMGGRILTEMFAPGSPGSRPLRRIPTYQPDGPRQPLLPEKTEADEKILEELRTLGYIR